MRTPDGIQARSTSYSTSNVDILKKIDVRHPGVIAIVNVSVCGDVSVRELGSAATSAERAALT